MDKTNSPKELSQDQVSELETLNPAPGSIDIRNRVPDLLLMLGLDINQNLRESGFSDDQIKDICLAIRRCPCFISINYNESVLSLTPKSNE